MDKANDFLLVVDDNTGVVRDAQASFSHYVRFDNACDKM